MAYLLTLLVFVLGVYIWLSIFKKVIDIYKLFKIRFKERKEKNV